jgi:hypothetical protein
MVELIYKTPWAGMYNGFLGESKFKRRKGQLLYAHIIKKHLPELGKIVLDRGYKPNDLLLIFPFNFIKIALGVIKAKRYMAKKGGNDTFKTELWAKPTMDHIASNLTRQKFMGKKLSINDNPVSNSGTFLTLRHFSSLKLFLNLMHEVK